MQIREAITEVIGAEQLAIRAKVGVDSSGWASGHSLRTQVLESFLNRQLANIGANISHIVCSQSPKLVLELIVGLRAKDRLCIFCRDAPDSSEPWR